MTAPPPSLRWWPFAVALPLLIGALVVAELTKRGPGDPRVLLVAAFGGVLIAWLVWIVPPSWAVSAALVLSMFGGNWQYIGLPKSVAPDRLVLGLAILAIAVRAPGARDRVRIKLRPLVALMYLGGVYAIGSAIAVGTISDRSSLFDLLDRMQILEYFVYIVIPVAFVTAQDRRILLAALVGMGIYLGLTGIFEILGPHALVFPRYINDPHVRVHFGRARGPFVQAAVNGLAMYACILGSLIGLREFRPRRARVAAMLAIAVCSVSLLLTYQRTIWVGLAVAVPVTMLAAKELRRYLVPVIGGVVLMVAVALAIPNVRTHITTRTNDTATVQDRQALDDAAIAMVNARPLFGFGWGKFITVAPDYFQTSDSYSVEQGANNPLHDVYASIATELGVVGLALWTTILLVGVGGPVFSRRAPPGMRPWRIALGSLLILWLVAGISSPLASSFQSLIIWLWAAVVIGSELGPVIVGATPPAPTSAPGRTPAAVAAPV